MGTQLAKIDQFQIDLAQNSKAIQSMLPPQVDLAKFQRITFTAIQRDQSLLGKNGLMDAVLDCAKDGLIPDGREAVITAFGATAVYMPMVSGILKKVRQSGELKSLSAQVVYEADTFDYFIDEDGPHFTHKPEMIKPQGSVIGAYAVAITKDEGKYFEFMNKEELDKIKSTSPSGDKGPWGKWYSEMAKKSAIRRLSKWLPMSTDVEGTIRKDDQFYDMEPLNVTPTPQKKTAKKDPVKKGTSPADLEENLKKDPPKNDTGKKSESGKEGKLDIF